MLAGVDRLMSGAISCGQGNILLSAGGRWGAFLVGRWLLWVLVLRVDHLWLGIFHEALRVWRMGRCRQGGDSARVG